MNDTQAARLGRLLTQARKRKGLSLRALTDLTGISYAWLYLVEGGSFNQPAAERLTKLAEALDIDPEHIERITQGHVSKNLPSVRTYFRTKFELAPDEIDQIEDTIKQVQRKHNINQIRHKRKEEKKNDNPDPTN
jgi:transcriptional regulator with XRE-family HTH domain